MEIEIAKELDRKVRLNKAKVQRKGSAVLQVFNSSHDFQGLTTDYRGYPLAIRIDENIEGFDGFQHLSPYKFSSATSQNKAERTIHTLKRKLAKTF